ncbi:MAG: hypothetical protein KC425_25350, partial [Anaerolineales bacterium]|nr:hypothetical protein [Anaerolineales bacterium]
FPVDFKQPGAHLFFTALTFPHITLGTALILISVRTLWRLVARPSWPVAIALGLAHLLLGIAYPFLLYLVMAIAALLLLYRLLQDRRIPWRLGWQTAVSFLIPAPLYVYYAVVLQTNAVFAAWDAQAGTPSAPWPHYLLAFGPMLLLGALFWWRRPAQRAETAVLWLWVLAAALLLYAPLNPQRRFVQGVHAPLAILAARGWLDVVLPRLARSRPWRRLVAHPRYSTAGLARLLTAGFLFGMSVSNLYVLASLTLSGAVQQPDPLFRPRAELDAAAWLRANAPLNTVVLGAYQTGNLVAAQAGQRVVLGHWAETVDPDTKTAEVARFFAASTPHAWRAALLTRYRVAYVWFGPREAGAADGAADEAAGGRRETAVFNPAAAPYLSPVYTNDTITIYQVTTP